MPKVTEWMQAFKYANHMGFAGSGSIASRQYDLAKIADGLEKAAGGYPYTVTFKRSKYSPSFPYLGEFEVKRPGGGGTVRVSPGRNNPCGRNPARRSRAISRESARGILRTLGIPLGEDFHTLGSSKVDGLLDAANRVSYRKPASASGSRARSFHSMLQRKAGGGKTNPRRLHRTVARHGGTIADAKKYLRMWTPHIAGQYSALWSELVSDYLKRYERTYGRLSDSNFDDLHDYGMEQVQKAGRNPRRRNGPVEVKEISAFIQTNDSLKRQQFAPIVKNLAAKKAKGIYQHALATKLFRYLVDNADKMYFSSTDQLYRVPKGTRVTLSTADRNAIASALATGFEQEYARGAYDHLIPAKWAKIRDQFKNPSKGFRDTGRRDFYGERGEYNARKFHEKLMDAGRTDAGVVYDGPTRSYRVLWTPKPKQNSRRNPRRACNYRRRRRAYK